MLRQNRLLTGRELLAFAQDRAIPVARPLSDELSAFVAREWITPDEIQGAEAVRFHPFRIYSLYHILRLCELRVMPATALEPAAMLQLLESRLDTYKPAEEIQASAATWTERIGLATLLEPIFWPQIVGHLSLNGDFPESVFRPRSQEYEDDILSYLRALDAKTWQQHHEQLRREAAFIDSNTNIYALLRASTWARRAELKGSISTALWIRHMAELIRRGFELAHGVEWEEEDRAFATWAPGARERTFGSDRPFSALNELRRHVTFFYGLNTGAAVRWYVEGATEYFAISELLPDFSEFGIELVPLMGTIHTPRDNAALRLQTWLEQDRQLKRFSMISFDLDVGPNEKAIRRALYSDLVVGLVCPSDPDFEFANFQLEELIEIAARMDERLGFNGYPLRTADWGAISEAGAFETRYRRSSETGRGLKGENWGRALAKYAAEKSNYSDGISERPIITHVKTALRARTSHYERHADKFTFDPVTFKLKAR